MAICGYDLAGGLWWVAQAGVDEGDVLGTVSTCGRAGSSSPRYGHHHGSPADSGHQRHAGVGAERPGASRTDRHQRLPDDHLTTRPDHLLGRLVGDGLVSRSPALKAAPSPPKPLKPSTSAEQPTSTYSTIPPSTAAYPRGCSRPGPPSTTVSPTSHSGPESLNGLLVACRRRFDSTAAITDRHTVFPR